MLILDDRGLLPLDAATRDFLKNYTRLDTGQDVVAKDRELRKTKTTTAPKAKRGLKRARSLGDLYVAEVKHRKRYRREEVDPRFTRSCAYPPRVSRLYTMS